MYIGTKKILIILSVSVFIVSLFQIAYCTTNLCRGGLDALLLGFVGVFYDSSAVPWLANPILIMSWVFMVRKQQLSLVVSVLALTISLYFILLSKVVDNEAGHLNVVIRYGLGYWLWVLSSLIMVIGNTSISVSMQVRKKKDVKKHTPARLSVSLNRDNEKQV